MNPDTENLICGWLCDLDHEMDAILVDLGEIRVSQDRMAVDIENLRRARNHTAGVSAHLQIQIDRLHDQVDRINRRLDIAEA